MKTLVLHQVPVALYRRLKAVASAHRRSMNQEASTRWLELLVWTLPVQDDRSAEEILGYGDDGLCG